MCLSNPASSLPLILLRSPLRAVVNEVNHWGDGVVEKRSDPVHYRGEDDGRNAVALSKMGTTTHGAVKQRNERLPER